MRESARLTTDVSSCARKTPRHMVINTSAELPCAWRRGCSRGIVAGRVSIWCMVMPARSVRRLQASRQVASVVLEVSRLAISCAGPHIESMSNAPHIAEVAALVGDPARANILCALLGGRALTATELAFAAGVSPQTTSGQPSRLHAARLLMLIKQGRHRYYRLAGPHVGQMLEGIMNVALTGPPRFQPKSKLDDQLRRARTCYDHIAG